MKNFFVLIVFLFGCATYPQKPDVSYYEALAEKDAIENTVIDNKYYGVTLDEKLDVDNYTYIGIDKDCRCKKYGKVNSNDIFDFITIYTDMDDKAIKMELSKWTSKADSDRFYKDLVGALKTKYPKLSSFFYDPTLDIPKDMYKWLIVRFTNKEDYKTMFIRKKKAELRIESPYYNPASYYRESTFMIHPVLSEIVLMPLEYENLYLFTLTYKSKKYQDFLEEDSKQRKKEMIEKLGEF